jgi:AcrR family transcriptional regulator
MTSADTARRRRLEPDARREQILETAIRLFGERPYSAVSTSELAEAAGVTRGLLHHYFGSKRDLYIEVVRRLTVLPTLDDEEARAAETLEARVELCVSWFLGTQVKAHTKTYVAILGAEGVGDDPAIDKILADADDLAARKVLKTLGVRRPTVTQRAMIRAYGGMLKSAIREWGRYETLSYDEVRTLLTRALMTTAQYALE